MRVALGRNGAVGGALGPEEVAELGDHVAHGRERVGPAGADAVGQAAGRGVRGAHACDPRVPGRWGQVGAGRPLGYAGGLRSGAAPS